MWLLPCFSHLQIDYFNYLFSEKYVHKTTAAPPILSQYLARIFDINDWNPGAGLELIIYYFKTVLSIVTFFLFVSMFVSYVLFVWVCVFLCVCATMCFYIFYIFFFFIFLSLFSFVNSVYSLVLQTQSIYQFPKIKKN